MDEKKGRCILRLQRAGRLILKKSLLDVGAWVNLLAYEESIFVRANPTVVQTEKHEYVCKV